MIIEHPKKGRCKDMKKIVTVMLSLVLCCGLFAGCGDEREDEGIKSATYDPSKEQIVVATNAAFAPFEYTVGDRFAGIDMEIAKGFADSLGQELVILDMEFDSVVTSVGKNGVDIAMAGLTVTEKRKESVNFTDTYYNASQMVIVKADDTTFDDCTTADEIVAKLNVSGVKIGVQAGTTGESFVRGSADLGFDGLLNVQCVAHSNAGLAVTDMKNGNVNYVVVDEAPAKNLVGKIDGIKVIDIKLTDEEYAFGVDKAQPDLLESLNAYLKGIKEDGTFDGILSKYFQG